MYGRWPLLLLALFIVVAVPAFAQEQVPVCSVNALGGTFVNDLTVSGKVGIGTPQPQSKLQVMGNTIISGDINSGGTITGAQYCIGNSCIQAWPAGGGQADGTGGWTEGATATSTGKQVTITSLASCAGKLYTDASGNLVCGEDQTGAVANAVTGVGNANNLPKWTGANQVGNSIIFEKIVNNEGMIGIGNANPTEKLEVAGKIKATVVKGDTICLVAADGTEDCRQAWPAGDGGGGAVNWADVLNRPAGLDDGDQVGITNADELDPTVPDSIKDGVDWTDIIATPAGFSDGVDDGITAETDPTIDKINSAGAKLCTFDAATQTVICKSDFPIIDWTELTGVPADLTDGDQVGILEEADPKVGAIVDGKWCKAINGQVVCQDDLPALDEADPLFAAWDKSSGIGINLGQISDLGNLQITESQITDLQLYLTAETDPKFTNWDKSTGIAITESQISDLQKYLTVESDPTVPADIKDGLDWTEIADTPAGFADGIDDGITAESDPEFTNWDKSIGIIIKENQITDLQPYLLEETDPTVNKIGSKDSNVCTYNAATQSVICDSTFPMLDEQDPSIDKLGSANAKLCVYNSATQTVTCNSDFPIEADPEFMNWDKSIGIIIKENQITDLQPYLLEETDPTVNKISSANTKLCTFDAATQTVVCKSDFPIETDPEFTNWDKSSGIGINLNQINDLGVLSITESQISDLQQYLTVEADPTVPVEIKDGVDWTEIVDVPAGFADGIDDGITVESDPEFTNWDKSTGIGINLGQISDLGNLQITESQISDLRQYLTAESDPTVPDEIKQGIVNWANIQDVPAGLITGVGAQDTLARWTADGTLIDSVVSESDIGGIEIGNAFAPATLDVSGAINANSADGIITTKLTASGNVGIGTTAPTQILHVNGPDEILSTGTGAGFKFRDRSSPSPTTDWVWYASGDLARLYTRGVDTITVDSSGNIKASGNIIASKAVVAGTDVTSGVASDILQVTAGKDMAFIANTAVGTERDPGDIIFRDDNGAEMAKISVGISAGLFGTPELRLGIGGVDKVVLDNNGNVGIGTSTPLAKLDVAGNIKASGDINAGGKLSAAGNIEASGTVSVAGNINAGRAEISGGAAGISFADRTHGDRWELYSQDGIAGLYYDKGSFTGTAYRTGNKISISPYGEIYADSFILRDPYLNGANNDNCRKVTIYNQQLIVSPELYNCVNT